MHLPEYTRVLCIINVEEDLAHLVFQCPFSQACWSEYRGHRGNLQDATTATVLHGNHYYYVLVYLDHA